MKTSQSRRSSGSVVDPAKGNTPRWLTVVDCEDECPLRWRILSGERRELIFERRRIEVRSINCRSSTWRSRCHARNARINART